jgi:hypothetical protein
MKAQLIRIRQAAMQHLARGLSVLPRIPAKYPKLATLHVLQRKPQLPQARRQPRLQDRLS